MNWKLWGRGLVAAIINAFATTAAGAIMDPDHVGNPKKLVVTVGVSGVAGGLLYLKTHPLPGLGDGN